MCYSLIEEFEAVEVLIYIWFEAIRNQIKYEINIPFHSLFSKYIMKIYNLYTNKCFNKIFWDFLTKQSLKISLKTHAFDKNMVYIICTYIYIYTYAERVQPQLNTVNTGTDFHRLENIFFMWYNFNIVFDWICTVCVGYMQIRS